MVSSARGFSLFRKARTGRGLGLHASRKCQSPSLQPIKTRSPKAEMKVIGPLDGQCGAANRGDMLRQAWYVYSESSQVAEGSTKVLTARGLQSALRGRAWAPPVMAG